MSLWTSVRCNTKQMLGRLGQTRVKHGVPRRTGRSGGQENQRRKGKANLGRKPVRGKNNKGKTGLGNCQVCGTTHPPGLCPQVQCWTCKGFGHRSPDCGNHRIKQSGPEAAANSLDASRSVEEAGKGSGPATQKEEERNTAVYTLTEEWRHDALDAWNNGEVHQAEEVGDEWCKTLLAIYIFTGDDVNSAFSSLASE